MLATVLSQALENYLLFHDLAPGTAAWYRRVVSVFRTWAGGDPLLADFNGEQISRLLRDKKAAGRSPFYVKSLRGGLVAVLREIRGDEPMERVRGVRPGQLDPEAWTPAEVEQLLRACDPMPPESRWRWVLTIAVAYYTGLDRCDLWRIERRHISPAGAIRWRRSKTGGRCHVGLPVDVVALIDHHCPRQGPILHLGVSPEWFRRIFAGIVARSGLTGTFKKFRKTSGSLVEQAQPGTGHRHLGNTRAVFEANYEAHDLTRAVPTMPQVIRLPSFDPPPRPLFDPRQQDR